MMQKIFKSFVMLLMVVPIVVSSQTNNFEFVQHDTAYVGSDDLIILYGEIFNLAGTDQDITVTRVTHNMDSNWTNSFCVGPACLPPFLDNFTFTLYAADTADFSLDTYPNGTSGVGSWTMFAVDSSTMEVDSLHFTVEYVTVSIDEGILTPPEFMLSNIYPNPTNAWINFNLDIDQTDRYSVTLYTLNGREIATREYGLQAGKNHLQWGLQTLPSGNYIIRASNGRQTVSRQVSVIK